MLKALLRCAIALSSTSHAAGAFQSNGRSRAVLLVEGPPLSEE